MPIQFITKGGLSKQVANVKFPAGLRLADHLRELKAEANGHRVYEFIGTDTFGTEWNTRQRFEVNAGRDEEPLVYQALYDVIEDAGLPKNISVNRIGPGGVVFEQVLEGGEVKFSSILSSEFSVPIRHYATGLEYSKDLVVFNELWRVPLIERQIGIAFNALLNHLHLNPILAATYAAANQTPANTAGSTTVEDHLLTLEDAILNSKADGTNPRRGPYALLISSAEQFVIEKALQQVPQQGISLQAGSAFDAIRAVIVYDGWTGTRGALATTYTGVAAGTGYLVNLGYRGQDFQSYMKQSLSDALMETDISRFMTQVVWDTYFGVYANPIAATEEVTWP
jgi:hypothetical protein